MRFDLYRVGRWLQWEVVDRLHERVWRRVLGGWRVLRVVVHAMAGWFTVVVVFPRLQPFERTIRVRDWAQGMLPLLGVHLEVHGEPPAAGPVLLVANHISWLDILVLLAVRHCRFVAKSEVRQWPLLGTMATAAGTLYIERQSARDALRVVHQMAASLQAGEVLAVFPEGTTSTVSAGVLPFHGNLIQAAVSVDAPAVPVALIYTEMLSGRASWGPNYVGDDSLAASVWRTVSHRQDTRASVSFGAPQRAAGRDRRGWAADLRAAVRSARWD